jgi:hypothetical protein
MPSVGMLYVNLLFGVQRKTLCGLAALRANFFFFSQSRKGAKKLEKPFADWRLCESNFFFLTKTRNQPTVGRLGVN